MKKMVCLRLVLKLNDTIIQQILDANITYIGDISVTNSINKGPYLTYNNYSMIKIIIKMML